MLLLVCDISQLRNSTYLKQPQTQNLYTRLIWNACMHTQHHTVYGERTSSHVFPRNSLALPVQCTDLLELYPRTEITLLRLNMQQIFLRWQRVYLCIFAINLIHSINYFHITVRQNRYCDADFDLHA